MSKRHRSLVIQNKFANLERSDGLPSQERFATSLTNRQAPGRSPFVTEFPIRRRPLFFAVRFGRGFAAKNPLTQHSLLLEEVPPDWSRCPKSPSNSTSRNASEIVLEYLLQSLSSKRLRIDERQPNNSQAFATHLIKTGVSSRSAIRREDHE